MTKNVRNSALVLLPNLIPAFLFLNQKNNQGFQNARCGMRKATKSIIKKSTLNLRVPLLKLKCRKNEDQKVLLICPKIY